LHKWSPDPDIRTTVTADSRKASNPRQDSILVCKLITRNAKTTRNSRSPWNAEAAHSGGRRERGD
jgi:hypothetical protein